MTITLSTPLTTDADLDAAYAAGMLPKGVLVHGAYYDGLCRNATVARWHARIGRFVHWRLKFGRTFLETIAHPEDDRHFDVFRPLARMEPHGPLIPDDQFETVAVAYARRFD